MNWEDTELWKEFHLSPTEAGTESNSDWGWGTVFSTDGLRWLDDLGIQLGGLQAVGRGRIQHALVPAGLCGL